MTPPDTTHHGRLLEIADAIMLLLEHSTSERISIPHSANAGQFQSRLLSHYDDRDIRDAVRFLMRLGVLVDDRRASAI